MAQDTITRFQEEARKAYQEAGYPSYRKLANAMEMSHTTVMDMFTMHRRPAMNTIIRFARAINQPVNKWLEMLGYPPIPEEGGYCQSIEADGIIVQVRTAKPDDLTEESRQAIREFRF